MVKLILGNLAQTVQDLRLNVPPTVLALRLRCLSVMVDWMLGYPGSSSRAPMLGQYTSARLLYSFKYPCTSNWEAPLRAECSSTPNCLARRVEQKWLGQDRNSVSLGLLEGARSWNCLACIEVLGPCPTHGGGTNAILSHLHFPSCNTSMDASTSLP